MNETWETVITALGGYTVVIGALFWWISKRRLQSLLVRESGEVEKEVNKDNTELLAKHQIELEELKRRFDVEESVRQMLAGSFSNTQSQVFERRLNYIEDLWEVFYGLRDSMPSFLSWVDLITEDEYQDWIKRAEINALLKDLSMEKITDMGISHSGDIEKVRPFVGEYLWSLFFAYRSFSLRIVVYIFMEQQKHTPEYWKNDPGLKRILSTVLSKSEFTSFTSKEFGSIGYVRTLMDSKFLIHVDKILTGQVSIREGMDQARSIIVNTQQVNRDSK